MRKFLLSLVLMGNMVQASESYDVEDLYTESNITEAMAENSYGEIVEVSHVYEKIEIPANFRGVHKVSVTREGDNFYKINGTSLYIKTRHCYEYATLEDVVLIINSSYGYTKGEVVFPD